MYALTRPVGFDIKSFQLTDSCSKLSLCGIHNLMTNDDVHDLVMFDQLLSYKLDFFLPQKSRFVYYMRSRRCNRISLFSCGKWTNMVIILFILNSYFTDELHLNLNYGQVAPRALYSEEFTIKLGLYVSQYIIVCNILPAFS